MAVSRFAAGDLKGADDALVNAGLPGRRAAIQAQETAIEAEENRLAQDRMIARYTHSIVGRIKGESYALPNAVPEVSVKNRVCINAILLDDQDFEGFTELFTRTLQTIVATQALLPTPTAAPGAGCEATLVRLEQETSELWNLIEKILAAGVEPTAIGLEKQE